MFRHSDWGNSVKFRLILALPVVLVAGCGVSEILNNLAEGLLEDLQRSIESQVDLAPDEITFNFDGADAVGVAEEPQPVSVADLDDIFLSKGLAAAQDGDPEMSTADPETSSSGVSDPAELAPLTNVMKIDAAGELKPAGNAIADFLYVGRAGTLAVVNLRCEPVYVNPEVNAENADDPDAFVDPEGEEVTAYCAENPCPCSSGDFAANGADFYQVGYFVPHDGSAGTRFDYGGVLGVHRSDGIDSGVVGENDAGDLIFVSARIFRADSFEIEQINTTVDDPQVDRSSGNFIVVGSRAEEEGEGGGSAVASGFVMDTVTGEKNFDDELAVALSDDIFLSGRDNNYSRYRFGGGADDGDLGPVTRSTAPVTTYMRYITADEADSYNNDVEVDVIVTVQLWIYGTMDGPELYRDTDGAVAISNICAPDQENYDRAVDPNSPTSPLDADGGAVPSSCDPESDSVCTFDLANKDIDTMEAATHICLIRSDGTTDRLVDEAVVAGERLTLSGNFVVLNTNQSMRYAERGDASFSDVDFGAGVTLTQFSVAGSRIYYVGEPNIGDAVAGVYDMATSTNTEVDTDVALEKVFGIAR